MKGRIKVFDSPSEAVRYYVEKWYREASEYPDLWATPERKIEHVYKIETEYHRYLRDKKMEEERYHTAFVECVDFLTKIFTKKREEEERHARFNQLSNENALKKKR